MTVWAHRSLFKAEYLSICASVWRKTSVVFWMMFRAPHFKQPDFLKIMHLCGCTGLRKGSYTAAVCHAGWIYRTFISSPHGLFLILLMWTVCWDAIKWLNWTELKQCSRCARFMSRLTHRGFLVATYDSFHFMSLLMGSGFWIWILRVWVVFVFISWEILVNCVLLFLNLL